MNDITKISKTFFSMCLGALIILVGYLTIHFLVYEPPLYISPPEYEAQSLEKLIKESTNIEAIRKVCANIARCQDELDAFKDYHFNQITYFIKHFVVALFAVIIVFGFGFWRIWHLSKRATTDDINAL